MTQLRTWNNFAQQFSSEAHHSEQNCFGDNLSIFNWKASNKSRFPSFWQQHPILSLPCSNISPWRDSEKPGIYQIWEFYHNIFWAGITNIFRTCHRLFMMPTTEHSANSSNNIFIFPTSHRKSSTNETLKSTRKKRILSPIRFTISHLSVFRVFYVDMLAQQLLFRRVSPVEIFVCPASSIQRLRQMEKMHVYTAHFHRGSFHSEIELPYFQN